MDFVCWSYLSVVRPPFLCSSFFQAVLFSKGLCSLTSCRRTLSVEHVFQWFFPLFFDHRLFLGSVVFQWNVCNGLCPLKVLSDCFATFRCSSSFSTLCFVNGLCPLKSLQRTLSAAAVFLLLFPLLVVHLFFLSCCFQRTLSAEVSSTDFVRWKCFSIVSPLLVEHRPFLGRVLFRMDSVSMKVYDKGLQYRDDICKDMQYRYAMKLGNKEMQ